MVTRNITNGSSAQVPSLQLHVVGPLCTLCINSKGKGKVHLRTGHEGPERGEYMHIYNLSLTSVLAGGRWSTPLPCRFTPGKDPVPIL